MKRQQGSPSYDVAYYSTHTWEQFKKAAKTANLYSELVEEDRETQLKLDYKFICKEGGTKPQFKKDEGAE